MSEVDILDYMHTDPQVYSLTADYPAAGDLSAWVNARLTREQGLGNPMPQPWPNAPELFDRYSMANLPNDLTSPEGIGDPGAFRPEPNRVADRRTGPRRPSGIRSVLDTK